MNTMTENVEVIIANLDSKYKEANNTTNEWTDDCRVRFFLILMIVRFRMRMSGVIVTVSRRCRKQLKLALMA